MNPPSSFAFLAHVPLDWIIIAVFVLIVMFDAIRSGPARAATLIISLPLSALFFNELPHTAFIGSIVTNNLSTSVLQAALFALVFICLYLLTYRIMYSLGLISAGFLQAVISGLASAIVVVVVWLQVPALQAVWHFGPQIQSLFGASYALFWILLSYLALAFVRS